MTKDIQIHGSIGNHASQARISRRLTTNPPPTYCSPGISFHERWAKIGKGRGNLIFFFPQELLKPLWRSEPFIRSRLLGTCLLLLMHLLPSFCPQIPLYYPGKAFPGSCENKQTLPKKKQVSSQLHLKASCRRTTSFSALTWESMWIG